MFKSTVFFASLTASALLGGVLFLGSNNFSANRWLQEGNGPKSGQLQLEQISNQTNVFHGFEDKVIANGMVEFVDDIQLSSLESGVINEVTVKEGDLVDIDQLVCKLNQSKLKQTVESAKAQLAIAIINAKSDLDQETAKTALHYASRAVERVKDQSVFTEEESDLRLHEKDRAVLAMKQAVEEKQKAVEEVNLRKAEFQIAKKRLEDRNLKSPIAGMVISVDAKKGEWVNEGQPIARIVRLDKVRIATFVDPKSIDSIKIGSPATFISNIDPRKDPSKYVGKVVFISPEKSLKLDGVQVYVEIESPKPQLRNHSPGQVIFETQIPTANNKL